MTHLGNGAPWGRGGFQSWSRGGEGESDWGRIPSGQRYLRKSIPVNPRTGGILIRNNHYYRSIDWWLVAVLPQTSAPHSSHFLQLPFSPSAPLLSSSSPPSWLLQPSRRLITAHLTDDWQLAESYSTYSTLGRRRKRIGGKGDNEDLQPPRSLEFSSWSCI